MSSEPRYLNVSYEDSIKFDDNYKTIKITTPNEEAAENVRDSLMMDIDFAKLEGREDKDDYKIELVKGPENCSVKISGELTTALKDLLNSGFITTDKEKELRMTLGYVYCPPPKGMAAKIALYRKQSHHHTSHAGVDKPLAADQHVTAGNGLSKKP